MQVALVGVQWLTESLVKTPGRSVDGELVFNHRLHMVIKRGERELKTIDIDEPTQPTSPKSSMLPPSTPVARSKPRTSFDAYGVAVYSSPAFMKRLRLSEGAAPYTPVSVSEDDDQDTVASRKRRRVSYKNVSEWKFDAREPSPEKEQDDVLEDADGDEGLATGTVLPEPATLEAGNVIESTHDLEMQDADKSTKSADRQVEQPDSEVQSIEANAAAQPASSNIAQNLPADAAEEKIPVIEISSRSAAEPMNVQVSEEGVVGAALQQAAEATNLEETISEGASQPPESSVTSRIEVTTSSNMPPSTLPRLTVLPTESELLEQMARARDSDRPVTPMLQPLVTEGLPLPSPFPTSAQKMPSPVFSKAAEASGVIKKKMAPEEAPKTAADASSIENPSAVSEPQVEHSPEDNMVEAQEFAPSSRTVQETANTLPQESGQQAEATAQKPRIVADTYDGYTEEHPVQLLSDSEDDAASPGESSADALNKSGDETPSSSEDSESDEASSIYDAEQIIALQEESGDEGAIEEPDWTYLERKLEQEEAALQQSREDLTARGSGLIEADDDLQVYDADDAVIHDDNSELGEGMLARSDDDSDDDSDSSGYFDHAVMPASDDESSGNSEVEMMDESYQPSMPEHAMYSHPFGSDGRNTLTETRTALPSQATSENGSVAGDETMAWRDRDAAVEALQQTQQAQPRTIEPVILPPAHQDVPPVSSSRLEVVELLDDSESDEEGDSNLAPVSPETIDFLPSLSLVDSLLNNKEKDAHLELSGPATSKIRSEMRNISDQTNDQSTKWTKYNALRAVCKIGTNVIIAAEGGNMFAEGVKYRLKEDEVLVSVCWRIYNELSNEDKFHSSQPPDLLDCLEELEEKRDYCFDGFTDFLRHFKQNYHHMPHGSESQRVDQEDHHEVQKQPFVQDKDELDTSVPQVVREQEDLSSAATSSPAQQHDIPGHAAEPSERSKVESENLTAPEADVEATTLPRAEDEPAPVEVVSSPRPQSIGNSIDSRSDADDDESEADEDNSEAMDVEADPESADEHENDPALLEEEYEIDPALLESSSQSEGYEIDPVLLQDEHEIDPALLAEGHENMPSNGPSNPPQADETMSEAPEPAALPVADNEGGNQQSLGEDVTNVVDEVVADVPSLAQVVEKDVDQEAPVKSEIQQSVETDLETLAQPVVDTMETEASLALTSEPDNAQKADDESRPLSSSSFKTLSPTPAATAVRIAEPAADSAAQDIHVASQVLEQPIEELDLSQAEPSWPSRLSQFSQSRSSRAHTRSETIPDSADEEATDLEAENIDDRSRSASQEPATQASLNGALKPSNQSRVQPSQELGTAFSQIRKQTLDSSGIQSQLSAIVETPLPDDDEESAHELQSQVGIDDELLADYVQVVPTPEAVSTLSEFPPAPSSPVSTKKPARPLTLFRGRRSVGSRSSIGGEEQQTQEVEQQTRDSEQQSAQDEKMHDVPSEDAEASAEIARVVEGTTESDKQVQNEIDPKLISVPPSIPAVLSQPTRQSQEVLKEVAINTAAPEPETAAAVEQPQAPEVEQASSEFQIKPTLKPFAEVEASLFGTPIKGKTTAPTEPKSAPSQTWRNALSSKMSEVPVIGSWFGTPRRTTEVQKSATEHKAKTSGASLVEETPTKTAAASSLDRQKSISPPPLQRYASQGTSTSLSYFTPLAGLNQHLNQQSSLIDIVAVCTTATATAERAKSGPKDYYTTFRVIDQPLHEYNTASQNTTEGESATDVKVEIFRPFRQSLPKASPGDVVLLRGFVVRSRNHKNYLLSTAASGWCVWRYDESSAPLDYEGQEEEDDRPVWARKGTSQNAGEDGVREEVTGPPVEIGDEEREKVAMVKKWWETLQKGKKEEDNKEKVDVIMID